MRTRIITAILLAVLLLTGASAAPIRNAIDRCAADPAACAQGRAGPGFLETAAG